MPKSCKKVQYDLRKYVSFFKSMPSLLEGELSSISLLVKYQRATSSGFSREFLERPLSDPTWCEDSPGNNPAIYLVKQNTKIWQTQIQRLYKEHALFTSLLGYIITLIKIHSRKRSKTSKIKQTTWRILIWLTNM